MWAVVEFIDDSSVEVVPSYWFKNNKCAWPKKNSKKFIEKRVQPNVIEFDLFPARQFGKDIESYTLARQKAKKAEYTSNLSSNDSTSEINENQNTALQSKIKKTVKKNTKSSLWSPASFEFLSDAESNNNNDDKVPNFNPSDHTKVSAGISPEHDDGSPVIISNLLNSCPSSITVKKQLNFDQKSFKKRCSLSPNMFKHDKKIKTVDSDNIHLKHVDKNCDDKTYQLLPKSQNTGIVKVKKNKLFEEKSPNLSTYDKKNIATDGTIFNKLDENCIGTIITSASPFKISLTSNETKSTTSLSRFIELQTAMSNETFEFLKKMNRTLLNLKYDLSSLNDKVTLINDKVDGGQFVNSLNETNIDAFQTELSNLPLETEDELDEFEKKLANNEFKIKLVTELKRYSRSTLPSTIRAIMRVLFKDALLEKYSYKGLKKKKVFYTLAVCSAIFDAVKLMKKYHKCDAIDVETPLRTFISGAKFREPKQNQNLSSNQD